MDYPKIIVSNQKEEFICIQRVIVRGPWVSFLYADQIYDLSYEYAVVSYEKYCGVMGRSILQCHMKIFW